MYALSLILILLYTLSLFLLSAFFVTRALHSYEEYTLCGRSLTIWFIIFTYLATWIGGGTIIGLAGSSYLNGAGQYWIFAISCLTGYVFAFVFITRIRSLKLNSIGDMFALRYPGYHQIIRIPVTISLIIRNVTMIGMQFSALSYMLMYIWNIDRNLSILVTFLIITIYTSLSGLWGVVATDILQGFLQTIGMLILLFLTIKLNGGLVNLLTSFDKSGLEGQLSLIGGFGWIKEMLGYFLAFGLFFLMGDQSDWERILSGKTDKTSFWGYLIPLTITLILLLIPAYIGVFQVPLLGSGEVKEYVVYQFIFNLINPVMALIIVLTLFSAIMSSADSYMISTGLLFSNDIIKRFVNKDASEQEMIFWTRMGMVTSGAFGFAFAININDIIFLWISGIAIASIIVIPAYFMAWFSKAANTVGALSGMVCGMGYCTAMLLFKISFDFQTVMMGMGMNIFITVMISYLTRGPSEEDISQTYYWAKKFNSVKNIPK
jgi:SSS family solute:Na+ symporter